MPKNVLQTAPPNRGNAFALVRFYEKKMIRGNNHWYECPPPLRRFSLGDANSRSRAWVKISNMRYLGEDSSASFSLS